MAGGDKETESAEATQNGKRRELLRARPDVNAPLSPISVSRKLYYRTSNSFLGLNDAVRQNWLYEQETGALFNFSPVFLAIGIAVYFSIPAEPSLLALVITLTGLVIVCTRFVDHGLPYRSLVALSLVLAGMLTGKISTMLHTKPVIERQITADITATIISVDRNSRGSPRYTVKPYSIENLTAAELPNRVRLSASGKHDVMRPGEKIAGLVRLQPVSGPVYPGGYDFSFFAWFEEMGGSGFFMGAPRRTEAEVQLDWPTRFEISVNRLRQNIETRISRALPGAEGDIAVALVTGNKTGIPKDIQETLRVTGLAHILAISGLHMALVTLAVIWGVRALLACSSRLALNYPVKKIAVCLGFASATFYLMISGAGVATQRAWIMISVMLLAVFLDKRAITMRSVAIAALLILVLNPQSLFSPGFQMSFAAVAALVAGYEYLNKRRLSKNDRLDVPVFQNWFVAFAKKGWTYMAGIALTSLIAGVATGFFAAWHFHQVPVLGLLANLLAMPIVTTIVMPFVLASLLLMPYGLEFLALTPVAFGIELVVDIARYVETLASVARTGVQAQANIILFGLFLALLTIPKTRLRLACLAILPLLFFVPKSAGPPDIIVAENGRAIAVKTTDDELALLNTRAGGFVTGIWEKAWVSGKLSKLSLPNDQCNRDRCIHVMPNSDVLHIVYDPDLLQSSCRRADILIAPRLWWVNCREREPQLILKRLDFEKRGTHALYADTNHIEPPAVSRYTIKTALPDHHRPWHRNVRPIEETRTFRDTGG